MYTQIGNDYVIVYADKKTEMRNLLVIIVLLFFPLTSGAQQEVSSPYGIDVRFSEGVFLSFDDVRNNRPVPKTMIRSGFEYDDPDFFRKTLNGQELEYFDGLGMVRSVQVKDIWGFSRNGYLYVAMNDGFYRINILGSISHFIADKTVYDNYYNPYYSYYSPYSPYYYSPYSTRVSSEVRQYLLDFSTGNILDYETGSVEILLMTDPELHDEYMALSRRKKQQQRFIFIRKFNEKHPIMLPAE